MVTPNLRHLDRNEACFLITDVVHLDNSLSMAQKSPDCHAIAKRHAILRATKGQYCNQDLQLWICKRKHIMQVVFH
jgi:hypothetical protein